MLNVNPYGNDYQYVVRAYASNEAGRVAKTQILIDEALVSNIRQQQENERLTALLESKHEKINDLLRQFELQDQHYLQQIKEREQSHAYLIEQLNEKDQSYSILKLELQNAIDLQRELSTQIEAERNQQRYLQKEIEKLIIRSSICSNN
jgi:D-serine dehydratase